MVDKGLLCLLLGLIILCSRLTGLTGGTHVFSSSGENVTLACMNALSDSTSTTWIYSKHLSGTVGLIEGGIKKKDIERAERLSLGSDCSLNIYKTTEDHGQYTCQQYVNGQRHGIDTQVFLHVLHVSPSSAQTEMRSGSSVTLTCQLFTYNNNCDSLIRYEGIQVFWMNQTDVNLQTDSRYHISSSGQCNITLTTILQNEDNNTKWRCLVKKKNEIKISVSYTVKFTGHSVLTSLDAGDPPQGTAADTGISVSQPSRSPPLSAIAVLIALTDIRLDLEFWGSPGNSGVLPQSS
nr:uncharacterized protein LOC129449186 [Misgurnus anguillicaudatus]